VNDLSYADSVFILNENGRIDRQGTHHDLGFQTPLDESRKYADIEETILNYSNCEELETSVVSDSAKTPIKKNASLTSTARQTGDMSVYGYYFASVEWKVAIAFFIFQIAFAFLASFPCKYPIQLTQEKLETHFIQLSG
jgi:hypothetical protein